MHMKIMYPLLSLAALLTLAVSGSAFADEAAKQQVCEATAQVQLLSNQSGSVKFQLTLKNDQSTILEIQPAALYAEGDMDKIQSFSYLKTAASSGISVDLRVALDGPCEKVPAAISQKQLMEAKLHH